MAYLMWWRRRCSLQIVPVMILLVATILCGFSVIDNSIVGVGASETKNNVTGITISRKHITVWFDYSVRYYDHEADNAYSKSDLAAMVNVVSRRFSKIAIEEAPLLDKLPPEPDAHSRIWIPEIVAQHNKQNQSAHPHPMEVIVSFDVAKIARTKQVTSFDVAKYMADTANAIFPGTVKTLMMYTGFSIFSSYYNVKDTVQQLKVAREKIAGGEGGGNATSPPTENFNYDLAVFLDLKDCGHFKGRLGAKAKEFIPHVEIVVILLRPNYHQMTLTPDILHKMFVTKFEDCERKIKEEKSEVRVIPSALWMSGKGSLMGMVQCWKMMNEWARKNNQEVIMYEAFDTPNGHLLSDQGWWRLKDVADHEIKEDSFIEKILGDKGSKENGTTGGSRLFPNWEDSEEADSISASNTGHNSFVGGSAASSSRQSSSSSGVASSSNAAANSDAIYIALVLLSVICTLLVAVIVGLVYGFRSMVVTSTGSPNHNPHNILNGGSDAMEARRAVKIRKANAYRAQQRRGFPQERLQEASFQGEMEGGEEEEEAGASFNGSILEIRDTAPIVAVTYKK